MEQLQSMLGSDYGLVQLEYKESEDWSQELGQIPDIRHVRWGDSIQIKIAKTSKVQSSWTALLGLADGMVLRDGRWWPLCASYEILSQGIISIGEGLDIRASAFVTGAGAMARAGIAALFRMGFRKFRIVSANAPEAENLKQELAVKFFGIDIELVPPEKIVMLGGVSSIVLNTLTELEAPELVTEISYLNFLKRPGALIDVSMSPKQTLLLKEAADSAIPTLDGWHLAARIDACWADWAFNTKLDVALYEKQLRENSMTLMK
jgi:hypothetical protein